MLKDELKGLIISQGFTMSQVNDELNRRHGTNLSFQNFSNRFRKESFLYNEVAEILDIIGYKLEWKKNTLLSMELFQLRTTGWNIGNQLRTS